MKKNTQLFEEADPFKSPQKSTDPQYNKQVIYGTEQQIVDYFKKDPANFGNFCIAISKGLLSLFESIKGDDVKKFHTFNGILNEKVIKPNRAKISLQDNVEALAGINMLLYLDYFKGEKGVTDALPGDWKDMLEIFKSEDAYVSYTDFSKDVLRRFDYFKLFATAGIAVIAAAAIIFAPGAIAAAGASAATAGEAGAALAGTQVAMDFGGAAAATGGRTVLSSVARIFAKKGVEGGVKTAVKSAGGLSKTWKFIKFLGKGYFYSSLIGDSVGKLVGENKNQSFSSQDSINEASVDKVVTDFYTIPKSCEEALESFKKEPELLTRMLNSLTPEFYNKVVEELNVNGAKQTPEEINEYGAFRHSIKIAREAIGQIFGDKYYYSQKVMKGLKLFGILEEDSNAKGGLASALEEAQNVSTGAINVVEDGKKLAKYADEQAQKKSAKGSSEQRQNADAVRNNTSTFSSALAQKVIGIQNGLSSSKKNESAQYESLLWESLGNVFERENDPKTGLDTEAIAKANAQIAEVIGKSVEQFNQKIKDKEVEGSFRYFIYPPDRVQSLSTSETGKSLIRAFETLAKKIPGEKKVKAYKDGPTRYSIGWGTKSSEGEEITYEEAESRFVDSLREFEGYVKSKIRKKGVPLNQNQFDALVSFTYNTGPGGLNKLFKKYDGSVGSLADALTSGFNTSGGEVLPGLTRRRNVERTLFLGDVVDPNQTRRTSVDPHSKEAKEDSAKED